MSTVLPRTNVRTTDAAVAATNPLDSARLLIAMESFRGTTEPMRLTGPLDATRKLERSGVGIPAFDAVDVAFRELVPEVYFARVLGPAAASAALALAGAGGTSITVRALEPGEWANGAAGGLTGEVINGPAGASERIFILRRGGVEVSRTPPKTTRADLDAAIRALNGPSTTPIRLGTTLGADAGLPNVVAATNLAGGNSDSGAITQTHVRAALDRVNVDLGPMQVVTPGRNSDAANTDLLAYCAATDRTALLEQAASLSVATILSSAGVLRALGSGATGNPRLGGMWAQYATGPSIVPGQSRTVPWTIVVAGLTARLQRAEGHENVAPFGDFGVPRWATGLDRVFTEAESEQLVTAGVNVAHLFREVPRNRTFHTLEALGGVSEWVDLAHTRLERAVRAEARDVGRNMGARTITRNTIQEFGGRLRTRLEAKWRAGALFGDTPSASFRVDVDSVNDTTSIRNKEVNAAVGLAMNEHAEFVNIDLTKVPIGQEV